MNPVSSIARSGLNAATLRLEASARNIANMRASGAVPGEAGPLAFTPLEVRETPRADGGVTANLAPSSRAALLTHDPGAPYADARGMVATPDIDVVEEMLQLATARHGFTANLSVLRTADEMAETILGMWA